MIKTFNKNKILLTFIIMFSFIIRFCNFTNLPPSLFADEVDAGYQAVNFNRYGTDYYGNKLPIHFQSFSDWRTSAYIYSIALCQKLGFNQDISVRLPSVIFGTLSVLLIFLITKSKIAAFLMTISPWAIHYSRTGFEVSGMIMCLLAGIYFFQKFIDQPKYQNIYLSIFFFCLSPYFYSTAKFILPLILLILIIIWFKNILKINKAPFFYGLIFCTLLLLPLSIDTLRGRSGFRFSYIGIFTEPHREQIVDTLRYEDVLLTHPNEIGVKTPLISYFLHNKYQLVINRFINNYLSSFSTEFLLLKGDDNIRHGFGGHGLLYILDIIFVFIGLYYYFKNPTKIGTLFFVLLIIAPIPFSLTRDSSSAHATRLILMLPSLIYFTCIGISKKYFLLILYFISFLNFWHYYSVHYPQASASVWHSGMKETILSINHTSGKNIYFSDSFEPFLPFFLYYYPYYSNTPLNQKLSHFQNDYFDGQLLDNQYYFGHINWTSVPKNNSNIYIIPQNEYQTLTNKTEFAVLSKINKTYLSASDIYVLLK